MSNLPEPRVKSKLANLRFGVPEHPANPDSATDNDTTTHDLPVADIAHNPLNRRNYDTPEVRALGETIEKYGQLHAIGVISINRYREIFPDLAAKIDSEQGVKWVTLYGNRRLAGMRQNNLTTIRARMLDHLNKEEFLDVFTIENDHREQLPPIQQALDYQSLVEIHGSQQAVAERIKISQPKISGYLSLLKLIPELQRAVDNNVVTFRHALKLTKQSPEEQLKSWQKITSEEVETEDANYQPLITAGQNVSAPQKRAVKSIRLGEPTKMAEQIFKALPPDEIQKLLLEMQRLILSGMSAQNTDSQ